MKSSKWFDRKFDFSPCNNDYDAVYKRLQQAIDTLKQIIDGVPNVVLENKPGGKWSVKEHAGHLYLLEPLWRERIVDIQHSKPVLTPADLENKATSEAGFNNWSIAILLEKLTDERNKTLLLLRSVNDEDKIKNSLHPRLQQAMRLIDIAYFAAEHDEHHLMKIKEIVSTQV